MDHILKSIRDWSEVWALLIPLAVIFITRKNKKEMRPIVLYVWVGLCLSLVSTIMYVYHKQMPAWLQNNNLIYNVHSIVRLIFFSWFIRQFKFNRPSTIHYILLAAYGIFIVINFILWDPPHLFSNTHFIAESIFLLAFTIMFFFRAMQDESETDWIKQPAFLVCAGISLYEAVNFFTFLFFEILSKIKY